MNTLNHKLVRDLVSMKSQAITIGLVIAAGIAVMISSRSAYDSLLLARDKFYIDNRFSDGFAEISRAPQSYKESISLIPGISYIETRIVREAVLDFPNKKLPTTGRFVSITNNINQVAIQSGRMPNGEEEIVLSETFANANKLSVGDSIIGILGGKRKKLIVVGTGLSPEFVYVFKAPNPMPDDEHFGIIWMDQKGLESAFDMQGAFNSLVFNFAPGYTRTSVLKELDKLLEKYGGLGAYDRDKLPSHSFLRDEFKQLRTTAYTIPIIFLSVAAFLLHIVTTRIVSKEREQIATLKALGYSNKTILLHYVKLISMITFAGSCVGLFSGIYLGDAMTNLYGQFYKFPNLKFIFKPTLGLEGIFIGLLSGGVGAIFSINQVTNLQPAQAMRPPTPERYNTIFIEKYFSRLSTQTKMIIRNLFQRPFRTVLSILGISTSVMIMVIGTFSRDAIDSMLNLQFDVMQRESLSLSFISPVSSNALNEIKLMNGVEYAEGYRMVPIRIRKGLSSKEFLLQGIPREAELRRLVDKDRRILNPPKSGILLNSVLSEKLGIVSGDTVTLEILEGNRNKVDVKVEGTVEEMLGQGAYMERSAVNKLLGEGNSVSFITIRTDSKYESDLLRKLKEYPRIAGISTREGVLKSFYDTMSRSLLVTTFILLGFASVIAVGVVYNTAMIALSERSFELGSLRILGFTRTEVFQILAGELTVITIISLPIGGFLGYVLAWTMMNSVDTEGFKIPLVISVKTYGIAVLTTIMTAMFSFYILHRKIKSMDLLRILKVRE
ncbi:ABC transporter permease [Leptospira sp. GIMC2001]|uniref:ABC transporter permease n=1 Tax=Leptospira sp. GIMC2001 TaxID=1513297 RepID=UPI00234BA073|nr:FtsX-like permease family protein [Leptospira sp. GIMC2001]WCL49708.1 FtsX-like permease family protein [Leptospira sp. GIMC2001]